MATNGRSTAQVGDISVYLRIVLNVLEGYFVMCGLKDSIRFDWNEMSCIGLNKVLLNISMLDWAESGKIGLT